MQNVTNTSYLKGARWALLSSKMLTVLSVERYELDSGLLSLMLRRFTGADEASLLALQGVPEAPGAGLLLGGSVSFPAGATRTPCDRDVCGFLCLQETVGVILEVARRTGGDGGYHPEQWEEKSTVKQRAGVWEAQVSASEGCQEAPETPR